MSIDYKKVLRDEGINRAGLTNQLLARQLGIAIDEKIIGYKDANGVMSWYTPEGGGASYNTLAITGLSNSGTLVADANGNVSVSSATESNPLIAEWQHVVGGSGTGIFNMDTAAKTITINDESTSGNYYKTLQLLFETSVITVQDTDTSSNFKIIDVQATGTYSAGNWTFSYELLREEGNDFVDQDCTLIFDIASGGGNVTLQDAYDNSDIDPEIITNDSNLSFDIRSGSGSNNDSVLTIQDDAGEKVLDVTGNNVLVGNPSSPIAKLDVEINTTITGDIVVTGTDDGLLDGTYSLVTVNQYRRGTDEAYITRISAIWTLGTLPAPSLWTDSDYFLNELTPIGTNWKYTATSTDANVISAAGGTGSSKGIHTNGDIEADGFVLAGNTITIGDDQTSRPVGDQELITKKYLDDNSSYGKVKTDSSDPVADYLDSKIIAGTGITKTLAPDGGGNSIVLSADASGAPSEGVLNEVNVSDGDGGWLGTNVGIVTVGSVTSIGTDDNLDISSAGIINMNIDNNNQADDDFRVTKGSAGETIIAKVNIDGVLTLPIIDQLTNTPAAKEVITYEYAEANYAGGSSVGTIPAAGGTSDTNIFNYSDNAGGWIGSALYGWHDAATMNIKASSRNFAIRSDGNITLLAGTGENITVNQEPTTNNSIATKLYVDTHGGGTIKESVAQAARTYQNGAVKTYTITATGAAVGDPVVLSHDSTYSTSVMTASTAITMREYAYVSSANTVTVKISANGGALYVGPHAHYIAVIQ